jgi:trk system potassium uptake protein TrkA
MNIIIAGDGEVGFHLAEALVNSNHNITIVDPHEELLEMIESHADLMTIVGESNSVSVLKQAQVNKADLVISVLHEESINILTAILAKKLGAKHVIARVNTLENVSPENKKIYEDLGIDILISPEDIAAHEVINLLKNPTATEIYNLSDGKLSIYLFRIEKDAPVVGKSLDQIASSFDYKNLDFRAVAIHRGNETFLPTGTTVFQSDDLVYVISKPDLLSTMLGLSGKEDLELRPADRIVLFKFGEPKKVDFNKVKDAFVVEGEIKYPGVYAYKKGMKLSEILKPDLLKVDTNLKFGLIERIVRGTPI